MTTTRKTTTLLFLISFVFFSFFILNVVSQRKEVFEFQWWEVKYNESEDGIPRPREGHIMTSYKNKLWVYGGFEDGFSLSQDIWSFDLDSSTWKKEYTLSKDDKDIQFYYQPAGALIDDTWYIYGGMDRKKEPFNNGAQSFLDGTEFPTGDIIKIELGSKEIKVEKLDVSGTSPSDRWGHTFTAMKDDNIILFGGYDGEKFYADSWVFSTSDLSWSKVTVGENGTNPNPTAFHSANFSPGFLNQSNLVVVGGINEKWERTNQVYILDLDNNFWRIPDTRASLEARSDHIALNIGGNIAIYGGKKPVASEGNHGNIWLFNFNTSVWTDVSYVDDKVQPTTRSFAGAAVYKNRIYMFAGLDSFWLPFNDLWVLDAKRAACVPGEYYDEHDNECKPCDYGTYTDKTGQTQCKECSSGTYQDEEGEQFCIDCPSGKATDKTGEEECEICHFGGHVNKDRGQETCDVEPVVIVVIVFNCLCICYALFLLFVVAIWKANHQVIKASHSAFCIEIICGSFFGYAAIFFLIPYPTIVTCNFALWLICICFTLVFGGLFTKTFAIWRVFHNSSTLKKVVYTKKQLFSIVAGLLLIDIVILSLWVGIDPLQGEEIDGEFVFCNCDIYFPIIMIVYKAVLLLFGVFLAFRTRNLTSMYNESKFIALCIYNLLVGVFVIIPVGIAFASNNDPSSLFGILTFGIMFLITSTLSILFLPKLFQIFGTKSAEPKTFKFTSHSGTSS